MGGDLLFRYGNPLAYDSGTEEDRLFLKQHDANWIDEGLPGAGNILVHNNNMEQMYNTFRHKEWTNSV